jgi:putative intracellular protease/amidase
MTSPTVPVDPTAPNATEHIGILLFDDVEELDAVGPWEILSNWTLTYPQDGWTATLVSKDGQPVRAAKGMVLGATTRSRMCRRCAC